MLSDLLYHIRHFDIGQWLFFGLCAAIIGGTIAAGVLGGLWWALGVFAALLALLVFLLAKGLQHSRA